jgi:hypothetical protein
VGGDTGVESVGLDRAGTVQQGAAHP